MGVGAMVTVQDYEGHDTIELLQEEGTISTFVLDSVTTVFVDGDAVLMVDGVWSTNRLDIIFHDDHGYDDDDDNNNGDNEDDENDERDDVFSGNDDVYSADDADYGDNIYDNDDNGDNEDYGLFQ